MKQIQFERFGDPAEVLQCVEVDDPDPPKADEVIVRIEAFPVNPADLLTATGEYGALPKLPATLGSEAVGRVVEVGPRVTEVRPGDRVIIMDTGNWTELRNVTVQNVVKVPDDADVLQLAMLKVNPATAYLLLKRFVILETGDFVIQNIANSGVGRAVTMIGRSLGVQVVNVVRRANARDALQAHGEKMVVLDGEGLARSVAEITGGAAIRLALDAVAGTATMRLADCLDNGGTVVTYGRMSRESCQVRPDQLVFRDITLRGFWLSRELQREDAGVLAPMYDRLASMITRSELSVPVEAVYAMDDIAQAVVHAGQSKRSGKVLVVPNSIPRAV